jgi:hypothetical protein
MAFLNVGRNDKYEEGFGGSNMQRLSNVRDYSIYGMNQEEGLD